MNYADHNKITVRFHNEKDLSNIKNIYNICNYRIQYLQSDCFILAEYDGEVIGICRLCYEPDPTMLPHYLVARGMNVHPDYRNQKVGSLLIDFMSKVIGNQVCYLITYGYLEKWISTVGFERIDVLKDINIIPPHLLERYHNYTHIKPNSTLIMMLKNKEFYVDRKG